MGSVVLVTGVSRYLGGLLARRLAAQPGVDRVVGVDVIPPAHDIGGVEFVRADIRNPMIARVIENAGVDTVVHMNVIATPTFVGGRTPQKEINVIGTMQLLAACQKSSCPDDSAACNRSPVSGADRTSCAITLSVAVCSLRSSALPGGIIVERSQFRMASAPSMALSRLNRFSRSR